MASLRKRLQNLFSTNVIVRAYGKDKLRVVDTNRLQSTGNLTQSKVADRYTRLHGSNTSIVLAEWVDMIQIIICIKIVCSYTLITK
jgi:hypothetical protein